MDGSEFPKDLGGWTVRKNKLVISKKLVQNILPDLCDSRALYDTRKAAELWLRYQTDGYLVLRGLLDIDKVRRAQQDILVSLDYMGYCDEGKKKPLGWIVSSECVFIGADKLDATDTFSEREKRSWKELFNLQSIQALVHSEAIRQVFHLLARGKESLEKCNENARIALKSFYPDHSYLRIKGPRGYTPAHADAVYLKDQLKNFDISRIFDSGLRRCTSCEVFIKGDNSAPKGLLKFWRCPTCMQSTHSEMRKSEDDGVGNAHSPFFSLMPSLSSSSLFHQPKVIDIAKLKDFTYDGEPPMKKRATDCNRDRGVSVDVIEALGTCWIPIGIVNKEDGALALLNGSLNIPDMDKSPSKDTQLPRAFFDTKYSKNLMWQAPSYSLGDVVIFDCKTIHCTSKNYGKDSYRLSVDFRWALCSERQTEDE